MSGSLAGKDSAFSTLLGMTIHKAEGGESEVRMSVQDSLINLHGKLHGGAIFSLIDTALADNPNLQSAQARIRKAWSLAQVSESAQGPQVNGQANASRNQAPAKGMIPPPLAGNNYSTAEARINGSWSLDLFGKHRAALDAAVGSARAAQADMDADRAELNSRYKAIEDRLSGLHQAFARDSLVARDGNGREVEINLSKVVHAIQPNGMSALTKLGTYFAKVW